MKPGDHSRVNGLTGVVITLSAAVGLLHLAGCLSPGSLNWGFHFLGFLPWPYAGLFCLFFVAFLAVFLRADVEGRLAGAAVFVQSKPYFFLAIALAGLVLLAFLFRVKVSLLGDSFSVVNNYQEYEQGISPLEPWNEPFSMFFFYYAIKAFGSFIFPELFRSFFSIQLVLGVLFTATTFLIVRHLFEDARRQLLVFLFCLAFPYMIFFFGYIEIYAFSFLVLSVFVLVSILVIGEKLPFSLVPMLYVLVTFSHYVNGALLVSVLYLAYRELRKRRIAQLAIGFGGAALLVFVTFALVRFDVSRLLDLSPVSHQLSVSGDVSIFNAYSQAYTLFSVYHFIDIANYLVLMSPLPLGVIAYVAIRQRSAIVKASPVNAWFLCALIPVFLYFFFAKLEQGNADDWDVFASHFFLLNLFASLIFFQCEPVRGYRLFGFITGMSFLLSLPWLALNAQEGEPAIERFQILWDKRNVSHLGQYTMALRLTRYYDAVNDTAKKPEVWRRFRSLFPDDPRGYANEISVLGSGPAANTRRKLSVYEDWLKLDPSNPKVRRAFAVECANAGTTYHHDGKPDSARIYYSKALMLDSTDARVLNNLGSVFAEAGRVEEAISLFHKATFYDPLYADAYFNLGTAYEDAGKKATGLFFVRKAAELGSAAALEALKNTR